MLPEPIPTWGKEGGKWSVGMNEMGLVEVIGYDLTKRMSDEKWSSTALKAALRLALSTVERTGGGAEVSILVAEQMERWWWRCCGGNKVLMLR